MEMYSWASAIERLGRSGIRAIAFTRPGYGESTRHPNRTLMDGNGDLAFTLGQLGINHFVSVGWSAGGPPTVASGLLPGCRGAFAIASPIPSDAPLRSFEAEFEAKQAESAPIHGMTAINILREFAPR